MQDIEDKKQVHGNIYELRFVSKSINLEVEHRWDGKIYCKYGKDHHKSWWFQNNTTNMFLQTNDGNYSRINYNDVDVCVDVVEKTPNMEKLIHEFMTYIGGQVNVQFSDHRLPLIVNKDSHKTLYMSLYYTNQVCNKKMYFGCPVLSCKCGICKKCYQNFEDGDEVHLINSYVVVNNDHNSSRS